MLSACSFILNGNKTCLSQVRHPLRKLFHFVHTLSAAFPPPEHTRLEDSAAGAEYTGKMLKIWSMKQQQQKNEAAAGPAKKKKVTAAQLRVQKGMTYSPSITHTHLLI